VRLKAIAATTLLLLGVAAVDAQTPQATASEKPSPLSEMAHDFGNWLSRLTGGGKSTDHHRTASSPPLPRPRPTEPATVSSASIQRPLESAPAAAPPSKKIVTPLQIND